MGLAEKLRQRAALQGRTAGVECGELGVLTVEALPLRELELLYRGPDGARAVFYAACRELQAAGEELRRSGQVYAPDGILQFVSQQEAEAAARVVLELSGCVPAAAEPPAAKKEADTETFVPADQAVSIPAAAAQAAAETEILPAAEKARSTAAIHEGAPAASPAEAADAAAIDPGIKAPISAPGLLSGRTLPGADMPMNVRSAQEVSAGEKVLPVRQLPEKTPKSAEGNPPSADMLARQLLEGLRRASWVRGG